MLTVKDLTHEFDGQTLFKDVNLTFTQGNCYGIIGANGAGKSTLLKFISGMREPTKGEIFLDKTHVCLFLNRTTLNMTNISYWKQLLWVTHVCTKL